MPNANIGKRVSKPEADKTRWIFKHVLETIRSLDEVSKRKTALRDVYSPDTLLLRQRLKDYCERLLFTSPVEYGRKTEELLWRKAFYDVIQVMKLSRKNGRPSRFVESAFESHLLAAAGFYSHLLFRLQREFQLGIWNCLDFGYQCPGGSGIMGGTSVERRSAVDPPARRWAEQACLRCLVYLGDLARYQKDFLGDRSWILAQRYYYQAFLLDPDNGTPHNQLGTLVGSRYYGLDAAYHYVRCLACSSKFDGAMGNLERIFEKNRKRYHELSRVSSSLHHSSPEQQRLKDVRRFCIKFLHLMDILYNSHNVEPRELQLLCQDTLQDFNLCLFSCCPSGDDQRGGTDERLGEEKMGYLEEEIITKIVVLVIVVVHKLQSQGSKQVAAAIAVNLALFSHILNHVRLRLRASFDESEKQAILAAAAGSDDDRCTPTAQVENGLANAASVSDTDDSYSGTRNGVIGTRETGKLHADRRLPPRRKRHRDGHRGSIEDLSEGEDSARGAPPAARCDPAAMISDEEEEMNFLNRRRNGAVDNDDALSTSSLSCHSSSSSSGSSSSSDGIGMLMESQELRPGFLSTVTTEQAEGDLHELAVQALQKSMAASGSSMSLHRLLSGTTTIGSGSGDFVGNEDDLQRLSFDLLSRADGSATRAVDSNLTSNESAARGQRGPIRIPPGFDKDPETRYVAEIADKLAAYVIDTDTNSSIRTESDTAEGESSGDESIAMHAANVTRGEVETRTEKLKSLLRVITGEGLMTTVKILCDWLRCQPQIVATCIQSSPSLWSRMALFLNFLPHESELASREDLYRLAAVLRHMRWASECSSSNTPSVWQQKYCLREDVHLRKLPAVSAAHAAIQFDNRLEMTGLEEMLVRICHLRMFGYHMAATASSAGSFSYDAGLAMFSGPAAANTSNASREQQHAGEPAHVVDTVMRRNQLMRSMAQLRLQAEVSELEASVKKMAAKDPSAVESLPPYVVADTMALCDNLALIRQLISSERFVVIIPQAVIDQLDELKKELSAARDAIRWLEAEFHKGNRYIRAQKPHERMSTQNDRIALRKRDKETWRALELVDCCKYLSQHHKPEGESVMTGVTAGGMASVLTGLDVAAVPQSMQPATYQTLLPAAHYPTRRPLPDIVREEGVAIYNVSKFLERWRQTWQNKG